MSNKTIKIIILGIAILFLSVILISVFKNKDKNIGNNENRDREVENNERVIKEEKEEIVAKNFEELKNNHPEFSVEQLEFYRETARKKEGILIPCEGRSDENDCVASVAFLKDRTDICAHIENQETKIECANAILQKGDSEKIDKCWLLEGDNFIKCSRNLFLVYDKLENCLNLKSEKTQRMCESVFYYETALIQRDRELCKKITDEKLNQYCYKNID